MKADEWLEACPSLILRYFPKAIRGWVAAIVGARFVWAGFAFDPLGCRMHWSKPFVELRTEHGESGQTATCGQVTGAGVVADEHAHLVQATK